MPAESKEEYLGAIYELEEAGRPAKTIDVARRLRVNPASVTEMLKKLAADDLVTYKPYRGVKFTQKGRARARKLKRKHRIIERFLHDVLRIRKDRVHEQACSMEHVLTDEVEDAMQDMLGNPTKCPDDGKPIPSAGSRKAAEENTLESARVNARVKVKKLAGGEIFRLKAKTLGIREGKQLKVVAREPAGGPIVIKAGNTTVTLGRGMARKIIVEDAK